MTCFCNAQQSEDFGPKAKNRKPWQEAKKTTVIMFKKHDHDPLQGPAAKNKKQWKDECETYVAVLKKRQELKGPAAKNTRPEHSDYWVTETK
tara:strand:- start:1907 stop:2182 length:276 start_codon:yes stop_codon:yes gene_type:complete